jgi:hypothetical protein
MQRALQTILATIAAVLAAAPPARANVVTTNWSGYAALPPASVGVTHVEGSWLSPTLNAPTPGTFISFWVGIDGYTSSTVEQVGVISVGASHYVAWTDMYPDPIAFHSLGIVAGDTIHASVDYLGSNQYQLAIADVTRGTSYSIVQTAASALDRSSAEWIVEAPNNPDPLPVPDFGSVTFTGASATFDDGTTGVIGDLPHVGIDMRPLSGNGALAGPLDPTGSAFTVTVNLPEPAGAPLLLLIAAQWLASTRSRQRRR